MSQALYEVPSGVAAIITRGENYATRRESATTKTLRFAAFEREGHSCYQFFARGWYLVVAKHDVNRVAASE